MSFCWFMQVKLAYFSSEKSVRAPLRCAPAAQHDITALPTKYGYSRQWKRKRDLGEPFQSVPCRTKPNCTAQWKRGYDVTRVLSQNKHPHYLFRMILRETMEVSEGWSMAVALTVMNISKARASSTSISRQGTISVMSPEGADTPG